jgi:catalase
LLAGGARLFRLIGTEKQKVLFGNTARVLGDAPQDVKLRHIGNCLKADPAYGKGVADALGIPVGDLPN